MKLHFNRNLLNRNLLQFFTYPFLLWKLYKVFSRQINQYKHPYGIKTLNIRVPKIFFKMNVEICTLSLYTQRKILTKFPNRYVYIVRWALVKISEWKRKNKLHCYYLFQRYGNTHNCSASFAYKNNGHETIDVIHSSKVIFWALE